jgi:hypothetical protein
LQCCRTNFYSAHYHVDGAKLGGISCDV